MRPLTVNGITFQHGLNDKFEFYAHTNDKGWSWEIFRHEPPLRENGHICWMAMVAKSGRKGAARMLNTATQNSDGTIDTDPLYQCGSNKDLLLKGVADLVKAGQWPN